MPFVGKQMFFLRRILSSRITPSLSRDCLWRICSGISLWLLMHKGGDLVAGPGAAPRKENEGEGALAERCVRPVAVHLGRERISALCGGYSLRPECAARGRTHREAFWSRGRGRPREKKTRARAPSSPTGGAASSPTGGEPSSPTGGAASSPLSTTAGTPPVHPLREFHQDIVGDVVFDDASLLQGEDGMCAGMRHRIVLMCPGIYWAFLRE